MERAAGIGAAPGPLDVDIDRGDPREIAIVPPLDKIAGQIRDEPSWIGGIDPADAEYVGPGGGGPAACSRTSAEFIDRDDISPVAQAAIAHAQFETIHPFGDGNGRVGRCLIQVIFRRRGLAPRYIPPVSIVLGADKDAYISGPRRLPDRRGRQLDRHFAGATELAALPGAGSPKRSRRCRRTGARTAAGARPTAAALALIDLLPRYPIAHGRRRGGRDRSLPAAPPSPASND